MQGRGRWHYCGVSTSAPGSPLRTRFPGGPGPWRRLGPRRRAALGLLVLAVLLLHALVIAGWPIGQGDAWRRGGVQGLQALQVRRIVVPAPAAPVAPVPPVEAAEPAPERAAPSARAEAPPRRTASVARAASSGSAADGTAAPAPSVEAGGIDPPRYAARVAPAATLSYKLQRGLAAGDGELTWRVEGERYTLELRGLAGGAEALGWTSRGRIGERGLEPERFVARRRGRDAMAVNFQRDGADGGRITFSGPSQELPLLPGAQDRVSWMLQLGAILQADPTLGTEGGQVSIWVVGPRADAEVWTFSVQGRVGVELPERRIEDTVHLVREPRRPYDTRVEVWLDPVRHHLPVRVRLQVRPTGESTEFQLRALKLE